MINKDKQEIIDELLKNFKYDRAFETENFYYWVKEGYSYNNNPVSREEFTKIRDYAVKHGTLPFLKIEEKISEIRKDRERKKAKEEGRDFFEGYQDLYSKNTRTSTYSHGTYIRYSKKYDNLEVYNFNIEVRASARRESDRVLVFKKKNKIFSVNQKNYVLIHGFRWLSLKNWVGFLHRTDSFITPDVVKKLMSLMLGKKTWINEIDEIYSINVSNSSSRKSNSIDEAVELECGAKPAKIIKRAMNNNINDVISVYNIIDSNQVHYLTNFIKRNHKELNTILNWPINSHDKPKSLIYLYYLSRDTRIKNHESTVRDYLRMSENEKKRINLNISSYRTIKQKHDEISNMILERNRDKRKLRVSKIYPKIQETPGIKVEMIRSAERLNLESEILHHCVHSYKTSINKGSCAIYSLLFGEDRFTLEVVAKKIEEPEDSDSQEEKYEFKVNQLRGKYNCNPPLEMEKYVRMMCENNELILPENRVKFIDRPNEREISPAPKKEVVEQIGEKILSKLVKEKNQVETKSLPF